ncbi:hypothetical protein [Psychroserpens sp.]
MKHSVKIEKALFQVRFKPDLSYYDKLFEHKDLFTAFPHWQTDRMKIMLRDYDKRHSVAIQHDKLTYDTDKYVPKNCDEVIGIIHKNYKQFAKDENFGRLGHRFFMLVPLSIQFEELIHILNLKLFSKDFMSAIDGEPHDSTVTLTSKHDDIDYRLQIGPMKAEEVPKFISYNVENHVDPNSNTKFTEMASLVENHPEVSLYLDLDFFKVMEDEDMFILIRKYPMY